ncbi:MAG: HesA/MoeB/ThiF family protein [Paludibacteraceae bacterium]|nr:HesA/MoeB/ThiF family protein [Paludibacteraceae bacterium]
MGELTERYHRQILLPELGEEGQRKLRQARVLLVGVGGLGSPIALYLTGAGVGTIGLLDDDVVSVTNLHRQVLYAETEVGQSKAECAAKRLAQLNSEVRLVPLACRLTAENASEIISQYDIVVDGCDNFATRYVIDEVCRQQGKPYVYGSIQDLDGQVAVLGVGENPKYYTDLFPQEEVADYEPSKAVLGVTPAVVGSVEANQVIQLIVGFGDPLVNKLWSIDLRSMNSFIVNI